MHARQSQRHEAAPADALVEALRALREDDPAPVYVQIERRIRTAPEEWLWMHPRW